MSYKNKFALVTGGSRGIGAGVVNALREQGCKVAVMARDPSAIECDLALPCDVSDEKQQFLAFAKIQQDFGALDYAFVNAGITGFGPLLDMPTEEWDRVLNVNLRAAFISIRESAKLMRDGETGGSILACCSLSSFTPEKFIAHYNASKAGLMMLVKSAASELGEHGIRVNGIAPGLTKTEIIDGTEAIPNYHETISKRTPLGRVGEVSDITPVVLSLMEMQWVTGQTLIADGGLSLTTPTNPFEFF